MRKKLIAKWTKTNGRIVTLAHLQLKWDPATRSFTSGNIRRAHAQCEYPLDYVRLERVLIDFLELSDSDEDNEVFEEALDQPLTTEGTLELAKNWTLRYSHPHTSGHHSDSGSNEYEDSSDEYTTEGKALHFRFMGTVAYTDVCET